MEKDFNYTSAPKVYLFCLNAQCPQAAQCLRYQASQHINPERVIISVINPAHLTGITKECSYFQPNRLARYALGITHLLDKLPHTDALRLKKEIYNHFQRNMYYRIYNKERLIHPREQEFIRKLFLQIGIEEEPLFDEYIDKYDWDS